MKRGRKFGNSEILKQIKNALQKLGQASGYEIWQKLEWDKSQLRIVYYYLKKGEETGIFKLVGLQNSDNSNWLKKRVFKLVGDC